MNDLQGDLTIDTSAWIEFFLGTPQGELIKEYLEQPEPKRVFIPIQVLAEIYYILCRKKGENYAEHCIKLLSDIKEVTIDSSVALAKEAGKLKCTRTISLTDCSCIALGKRANTKVVFARKEKEIEKEETKQPFEVSLLFLE
ncbi:MAG: PIN domain-containing protein [Candidatus Heimdallarchaeota archaeon]